MTKEIDPVVDKSLEREVAYIGWHPDDGYLDYTINTNKHKCAESISYGCGFNPYVEKVEIRELVDRKESKSEVIEDFILELRKWCDVNISLVPGCPTRRGAAINQRPDDLLKYAEELKDKI